MSTLPHIEPKSIHKPDRKQVSERIIDETVEEFANILRFRLKEKGYGTFASRHEVLGVIETEMRELEDAVEHQHNDEIRHELMDVAVGCVFGVACIHAGTMDW